MMNRASSAYDYNNVAGSASSGAIATSESSHTYASIEQSSFAKEDENTSRDAGEFDSVQQRRLRFMTFSLPAVATNVRHVSEKSEVQEQKQQRQQFQWEVSQADAEHIQRHRKPPRHQQYDQEKQQRQQQQKLQQHQQFKNDLLEAGEEQKQHQWPGRQQEHQRHQPQHQQADHHRQLQYSDQIWKTEQEQKQCLRHEPRQTYKQPREPPETKSSAVAATNGVSSSETCRENCLQVKSAVLDAQSFRVSVKSLVRKLSDTTSQNLYFKSHKASMRRSQHPDAPPATQAPTALTNPTAATPQQTEDLPDSHGNKGVDTAAVVKGGVASLISKFQSQAQVSGCTKVMLRKSGTTQGPELKSETSASCESTDSGIKSNLVGNSSCSTELSKLPLRGDSERAPAGELAFGRIIPSSAAHKKVLHSERTFPNLVSWSSRHTGLGDNERLLELRDFTAEGQAEGPMGVSAVVKGCKIMQPASEKGAVCLRGPSTNTDRVLKDAEVDKSYRHSNTTLGNLRDSPFTRDCFLAGDNCRQFSKQLASSESSLEDVIPNEIACGKCTNVDSVGKEICKEMSFSGMSHVVKERNFLGISEVKGQEENVRADCLKQDFEGPKYSLESDKNTLSVMSGWEHDDSQEAVSSESSVLNQTQQVCQHEKERLESPVCVARNGDSRKPDQSTASKDSLFKPVQPSTVSKDGLFKPVQPSTVSKDSLFKPVQPFTASKDSLFKPVQPSTASKDGLFKPVQPSTASKDSLFKPVQPSTASKDSLFKPVQPSTASEDGVFKPVNPSAAPEGDEDASSSCSDIAVCEDPQAGVEENLLEPTTADTVSPCLNKEGNFNNHGQELSRLDNGFPSSKVSSHLCANIETSRDVAKQDMQSNATNYSAATARECNNNEFKYVLKPEETDIIFCEDKDVPLPEAICYFPDVLPHKVRSLIVRPAGNDIIEKQSMLVLPGPVKVEATSTKSQHPSECTQVKAQVEKKFDVHSEHVRGGYLAKSLTGKHKWKHTAFSGRTEKFKAENPANKSESSKPVQQLGYNMIPGARREYPRKQIRKPIPDHLQHSDKKPDHLQHSDKNPDAKSHRRNPETPTRPDSAGASRWRCNDSSLDVPRGGATAVFAGKQSHNILPRRNPKAAKIISPRGRTFGKNAFRNTVKTMGHETLQAGHNQNFRKYTSPSEPTRACENTMKVSEGVPLHPFSSIDASPKRSRKLNNNARHNTSCWRNNAGRMGVAQTATGGSRALGASQTSIATGGQGAPSSNVHNPTPSKVREDVVHCCKKPLLRPAAVKSDMSACNPLKSRPIFIRRTGQGAKKWPTLGIPGEMSFTKRYRSGSPMVSLRVCEGNSNKSGIGSGPVPANYFLPRADRKQDATHSVVTQARCVSTSEGFRRTRLSVIPANCRHNSSGRDQNPFCGINEAQECTGPQTSSKILATANPGLLKRTSPSARLDNKLSSRTTNVQRTVKHGHKTVKTFHNYSSAFFSNSDQMSQSVTEEAREVKECCIVVNSIEEAVDVAHSILSSAGVDFPPFRWDKDKGCPQEEEEEECHCDRNASSDSEEITKGEDDVGVYKTDAGTFSSGKCWRSPQSKNRHSSHNIHKSPAVECDVCLDSLRHQPCSVSKLKHCRKPSASIGEINLLDPHCVAEDESTSEITAPIPNVRRINIQPMICIPWSESIEHWRNADLSEQQQLFDQSLSVPEELISKMPTEHLSPDKVDTPARGSSQPLSQSRQRSVSTDASKDTHRNELHRSFQQRFLPQACSKTISGALKSSPEQVLSLETITRKESRSKVTLTAELISSRQQAKSESYHKTAYAGEHSEASSHEDEHGRLPNADLKAKCAVNLKSMASTSSNDACAQNVFSKQPTVECETGLGTSYCQNAVNTQFEACRGVYNTDAARAKCNACITRQTSYKTICCDPVCPLHKHDRYNVGMEMKDPNIECMDAVNIRAPKRFTNAESPSAASELMLPTTGYSDCRIPSSNNDYCEGYSERDIPGSSGLDFRESIIKPMQANYEAAWTENGAMRDENSPEKPHVYSVGVQYLTKTCTNEEDDSLYGCSYRKRRAFSEGDRTHTVGRVVQLRNLYEQRHWNSQTFVSPGVRYSRGKCKAVVDSSISEDACGEFSKQLVSVSKVCRSRTYYVDKLKGASNKRPENVAMEKTTNPPRLNLSARQDIYGYKRNNEGFSQSTQHPYSYQGIPRSVHKPITSPEGESQSVHSIGNSQDIPQSMNTPDIFQGVTESVDIHGCASQLATESEIIPDDSQGISESVRSFGISQGLPQSPPRPDQCQDLHLKQYQRHKVPLLAAKFSAAIARDLKRSATVLCSRYRDNDVKYALGRPSDERGKRESSLERMSNASRGWKDTITRSTTFAAIKGKKAETDDHKMHQMQNIVDTSQPVLQKEKSVNCHGLSHSQKKEIDDHTILQEQHYAKGIKAGGKSCTSRKMPCGFQQTAITPALSHKSGDVEETMIKQPPGFPYIANTCIEINNKERSSSAGSETAGINETPLLHWQYLKSRNDAADRDISRRFVSNFDTRAKHNTMENAPVPCTRHVQRGKTCTATELINAVLKTDDISTKDVTDDETVSTLNQTAFYGGDSELSESSTSKLDSASFSLDSLEACVDKRKQYPKTDSEYEKSQPKAKEFNTTQKESISTAPRENAELGTSPQKVFSQRQTRQKQNFVFDPRPPTGKTISREASREATQKPTSCTHASGTSLEISQWTPSRDTESSEPSLDMELICTAIDDSADSFNCLFIENVKYLKDMSGEGQSRTARHEEAPGIMKRKGSFSKQAGLAAAARDKKDRGPASRETDRTSGQAHGVVTSPKAVNPRPTKDSSVSPINVDYVGSHGKVGQAILYGESHESYERRAELTSSEADTLSLSNVSELHSAATASENSHRVSNIHQVTTNDLPSARHTAQVTTYDHSETGVYGNAVEDLQRSESGLTGDTGADMEARRRRRLLEKASDVSPVEASNWRSKVYQKENTNTSNASSFPHKETPWASYRSKETLSPIDNHTQEAHRPGDSRRRRSEDSNCGDLSERLARRRAKRLEEKRGSLSNDWSVDSQHDVERQWSRDSSVRSTDSFDVGDNDDRLSDHWCKQHDQDVSSGRRGSRNTCDSLVFTGSTDNHEEVQDKLHKPRLRGTDSEGSNRGESKAASSEAGSRKWSSKDSNFYSAESTSSLRSYDDASSGNAAQLYRTSLGQESTEREPVGHSRSRRKTPYQNWSEDSAFSEMKETPEDTLNINNNNDNSEIIRFEDISKYPSLKPGNEDFKNEAGEVGGSALGILGSCVVSSSLSPVNVPQVAGGFSGTESSEFSSREIEASKTEVLSLSKPNSALLATSREDGSGRVEELNCWGGSFEIPSQNTVTSQTERQESVQKHAEKAASANSARETNEAALSAPDRGDVSNENSSSPQPPESKAARKRRTRKDKSALRKSVLNMADVPAEYEGNTQVQHDVGQSEERPRRRQEGSFVSQHASFWENTAPNIQNATPAKQRANIPARYTGDKEKLTATRQKFMQNATATTETSSTPGPKPKIETHDDVAPIKIARSSTDFNQLLQKFSGSESNSEKSDAEIGSAAASGVPKRRSLVRRQEAKEVITSSEESDTRRTPDRTQSLKLPSRHEDLKSVGQSENNSILRSEAMNIVEKSPSFRSEFISRKWAGKSMNSSHREKETSPLRTVESYTAGVHHALAKEDHGITANLNVQQNHPAHSKSLSLPVEPSEVQGHRQRLSAIGDKHKDLKSTSSFQNTASVHTEVNLIKQPDVSTTAATTVLMDKVKSQGNSSLGLMSKSNESASSKKVASGHAYSTSGSESKPEKQPATVHTTKQADSSITTAAKVSVDKEKSPNTSLDFASKHKESVSGDKHKESVSGDKHKESVSGDKPAPLDVAAQTSSNIKPGIRTAEVHITKQAHTSVTTAANVSMDTVKNPDTKLDLVSKHKDSVSGDKAGSPHVSSQISSDSKTDTRAAEGHVTKQVDTSITLATMVSVVEAKSLNANLDLASKHQESQSSDMSALSHTDSQSSSQSKRDIHVAEVRVSKQADTSLATKVPLDKAKSPNTNMNAISKHNEPAASTMLPSPHFTSEKTQENKDGLLSAAGNITKHGNASSVTAKEKVPMDKVTSQNTDLDLISNNNELVTSDNSVSGHVASASSSDSKHKTAATVNTNKSAASAATTTATTLMEKTKSSITNLDHGSATSDTSSQPVTSSSSPERKPDLPPSTCVLIASSMATDASQHNETPVAKPRSSVEREPKPQANITNTSVTSAQSADFTSPSSNSSALTSSVSSSVLHSSSVSSDMTPNAGEVRRASSFKEATVSRTESMERRKGILKRNTSLNKHDTPEAGGSSSFPVLDPQLAKILMQRKQMLGDGDAIDEAEEKKDEVHELARRARPLSAAEEIEETLRYSLQKAAQRGVNPDDEAEGLKRISVADRVYSMQSKIEEEKYAALTPKSRSGLSTPRSRPRSGFITPTSQKSFDETNQQQQQLQSQPPSMTTSVTTAAPTAAAVPAGDGAATQPEEQPGRSSTAVSGPQLMEKLSELASATERYQEKRHRFQHRARSDWRYQTQPVTFEEIQAADR
ncbi:hypothetical protein BsWGS_24951 [Bradybaena similaris]